MRPYADLGQRPLATVVIADGQSLPFTLSKNSPKVNWKCQKHCRRYNAEACHTGTRNPRRGHPFEAGFSSVASTDWDPKGRGPSVRTSMR